MPPNSGLQILEIELTNNCNLNCKHCYVNRNPLRTFTDKEIFDLIDQVARLGVYRLVFTGGEPLLIKNIFEYAKYARLKNIPEVVLMTNGLLISNSNISDLKIFSFVQLSIDTPPKEKPFFRVNYFSSLEKSIDLLTKNKIKVHLQATMHHKLIPKMESLIEFARKKGVTIGFNNLVLIGKATDLKNEKLDPIELKKALEKIVNLKKEYSFVQCSDPRLFLVDKKRMDYFMSLKKKGILGGCIAGVATLYIRVNGDVLICPFVDYPIANIFKEKLEDIWFNNEILNKLRNRDNLEGKCKNCKYRSFCGGCRGSSLVCSGSLFESDTNCWLKDN